MSLKPFINPRSMACGWKLTSIALLLVSTQAQARNLLPGETETITGPNTPESWGLASGSRLTVNNGQTLGIFATGASLEVNTGTTAEISAHNGSNVALNNALVSTTGFNPALELVNSTATIIDSTLTAEDAALQLVYDVNNPIGSTATVTGSTLQGGTAGALGTSSSILNFTDSTVQGTNANGVGLDLRGAQATATGDTRIIGGLNGVLFQSDGPLNTPGSLSLDNSSVQGISGAAIRVDLANAAATPVTINVLNGSTLSGGNGNILEVGGGATANLTVDQSTLSGDVVVEDGSTASVRLQNGSSLLGNLINVSTLTINNTAQWVMTGSNQLNDLSLNGGSVRMGGDQDFYRLDVVNLSGNGSFFMASDLSNGSTDFLNVTGTATGNHQLLVAATGQDPVTPDPLQIGNVAAGDATFSLPNDKVDAGAYTYRLVKEGEGLFLRPDKTTPSTGSKAALAIAGTAPTVLYAEMTTLNTRMGDRRLNSSQPMAFANGASQASKTGMWIRAYGNKYNVANAYGDGYTQSQQGLSIGADAPLPFGDGQWLLGGFGGYSTTKINLKSDSKGEIDSVYLGGYLTWYDAETGYYVDTVAKLNQFDNTANLTLSDGTRTKGDYKNLGLSGSVEVGKHIALQDGFFIEPSAQLNAAVVQGKNYRLDNGLHVKNDETRSLLGKFGIAVGREITLDSGSKLQPRIRTAVSHEFIKSNRVQVNDNDFNNDLSTTSIELVGGVNWALADKKWQVYGELSTSKGKTVSQEVGGSVGVSYSF